jgi:hypothetical protein
MKIKTTLRFHFTPVRMARMWRTKNPHTLLVGMQISTTTMENSMEVPQKTKNRTEI